ncbi:hybrid sensor histidine kinase/response regulator [Dyadobacter alkalitolerans]|uniref:hybrid sensor histidine kinase/response regulator n=1 Tax=Dyadobacter alkalitolerans TaxID=492736 RepID=UPI0003FBC2B2|nr:hybrid sensor histidine kinase/response regulator [Dyadobacter alkalitolerans]
MNDINTSILIIDDEEMVRDNMEEILVPRHQSIESQQIDHAASILFDAPVSILAPLTSNIPIFKVEKASNGMEGLEKVKASIANNSPYAVIFLDMRMPGWDGLETAIQIRKFDSKAEIIFVTAFTDRSIEEIIEQAGQNVGYHCKPYASEEIIQLATKAVTDYSRLRNLESLIESIASIGLNERQLTSLLKNILDQLAATIGTDMAFLGRLQDDFSYEKVLSIGAMEEKINLDELVNRIRDIEISPEEVVQLDELVLARLNGYSVFAVLKKNGRLKTEKMYLLRLFVQNAAHAIRNAEMNEELIRKEKLSAVGRAIGMVIHDLRPAIGNIQLLTGIIRQEGYGSDWLDMIDRSAGQASEIFEDFLDFIRETPVEKQTVFLKPLLEGALKQLAPKAGLEKVSIQIEADEELTVHGDQSKLKRVVINLVNNAVDALLDHKVNEPKISIAARKQSGSVSMQVRDNGPGIPSGLLKTLFEPFVTKNKSHGTGLGLAIVKHYVTAHGGKIAVLNDDGAVFNITL